MTIAEQDTQVEKIWRFRRVVAFIVDFLWVTFLVVLIVRIFFGAMSDQVRVSGLGASWSSCAPVDLNDGIRAAADKIWQGKNWNQATLCDVTSYGLAKNRFLTVTDESKNNGNTIRYVVHLPLNHNDQLTNPFFADWLAIGIWIAVLIVFPSTALMTTPGLWLAKLKITNSDDTRLSIVQSLLRFCAFLLPTIIIASILALLLYFSVNYGMSIFAFLMFIAIAIAIEVLWWWPHWIGFGARRAAMHDLLCGTSVRPR